MEGASVSLILDVVIVVLLGLTIVYAARLSLQLRRLRDSKSDLDKVVKDLIRNLDRADRAIAGMKITAQESGGELQEAIDKAMSLSDELQIITDSGDKLANRLEALVDAARPMAPLSGSIGNPPSSKTPAPMKSQPAPSIEPVGQSGQPSYAQHLRKLEPNLDRGAEPVNPKMNFAIRDPDAERGLDPNADKMALEDDGTGEGLYSEAERDLFKAMKNRVPR